MRTISSLGTRIAYVRCIRSVTQAELANATELSADFISKVETGKRALLSLESLCKIASYLNVSVGYLWDGIPGENVREQDQELIRPVTRLLLPVPHVSVSVDDEELTIDKLRHRVIASTRDLDSAQYEKVVKAVTGLADSINAAISIHTNEAKNELYRLLAQTYLITAQSLMWLRAEHLATYAMAKALEAADQAGDVVLQVTVVRHYSWAFSRLGMFDEAEKVAIDMAERTEPTLSKAMPDQLAAWGLLMDEASQAATKGNRLEQAKDYSNLAHSAAVRLDTGKLDYARYWTTLHPSMIGITRADNALTIGDAELALRIGSTVRRVGGLHLDWWTWHLLVMADARLKLKKYTESIDTIKSIRKLAPEWVDNHRMAHDIVRELLDSVHIPTAKATGLTDLARAMRVDP